MVKKIIFSLILFIAPLFANDALACYMVTFNANGGDSDATAYYDTSTEGWYSDSSCAKSVNIIDYLPTRKGYQLRGFWGTQLADVSANDTTTGLFVSNDGVVKQAIPKFGATLYAAWAQDCENNCSLTIGEDGSVTYSQLSNPDCYMVTLDTNNGIFSGKFNDNKLYFMGGLWYTDSMCANEYTGTTELVPSRTGYVFRGFYNSLLSDISETTTAANTSSNLCIANNGNATGNCRILEPITIYAAWAQDCTVPSNGTCVVTAGTDGGVDYTTTCATGYEPQQDQNTATPSCTRGLECYKITFDYNGGSSMTAQPSIYKQQGMTGFFSDANCTTPMTTTPILKLPTRTGYTLRGFYNTDLADVSENASNGNLYATNKGQLTPFATSWTITDGSSTLYAAWAQDCAEVTNGTCILEIGESTGAATYNTSCNSGYAISNGGTANPTCTSGFWNGGGGGSCGDVVNINFWGLNSNGSLVNLTGSAKPTFTNSSGQWKTSGGTVVTTFKSLGVSVPTISSSITVSGTTYAKGIKPYRAQWVGGTPTVIPDGMVATSSVCSTNMDTSRDIALDGSLPNITDAIENYATEANYIILYAANCIDPTGATLGSTCSLSTANGGATYSNTCLPGTGNPTFWQAAQTCLDYDVHEMEQGACAL